MTIKKIKKEIEDLFPYIKIRIGRNFMYLINLINGKVVQINNTFILKTKARILRVLRTTENIRIFYAGGIHER